MRCKDCVKRMDEVVTPVTFKLEHFLIVKGSVFKCVNKDCPNNGLQVSNQEELEELILRKICFHDRKLCSEEINFIYQVLCKYNHVENKKQLAKRIGIATNTLYKWGNKNSNQLPRTSNEKLLRLLVLESIDFVYDIQTYLCDLPNKFEKSEKRKREFKIKQKASNLVFEWKIIKTNDRLS